MDSSCNETQETPVTSNETVTLTASEETAEKPTEESSKKPEKYVFVDLKTEFPLLYQNKHPCDEKTNLLNSILFWSANVEKYDDDFYFQELSKDKTYSYRVYMRKYIFKSVNELLKHHSLTKRLQICHEFEEKCKSYLSASTKAMIEAQVVK